MSTLAASLGGFPLTLYEAALPASVPELWLDEGQCDQLIRLLAQSMGPSRAHQSWKQTAFHPRQALERSGVPVAARTFASQADLEAHFGRLKDQDDWHATRTHWRELKRAQAVWHHLSSPSPTSSSSSSSSSAAFVAVDVETWEQDHDLVTEVGIASLVLPPPGSPINAPPASSYEHLVLTENAHRRNGRYCPDARDDFQLGASETLPRADLAARIAARLRLPPTPTSGAGPVFLLLHDSRGDVRSLTSLGLDLNALERAPLLPDPSTPAGAAAYGADLAGAGFLLDTQRLYSGWSRRKRQVRLEDAVRSLGVALPGGKGVAFHNSGNDAWATLEVFHKLMGVSIGQSADEVTPPGWTPGGRAVAPAQQAAPPAPAPPGPGSGRGQGRAPPPGRGQQDRRQRG